jgi:hydroxymethylglutaryl-CoA lyase
MNAIHPEVRIVEVGPRDGLQNEKQPIATATKLALIEKLANAGVQMIEATSFVSPKWVPQLADAAEVMAGLPQRAGLRFPVLVPNEQGLARAIASGARDVAVFTAASDAFNQRNINCDIETSLQRIAPVVAQSKQQGLWVRGYVSCVLGCPYQGAVPVADVVRVTQALATMGCDEISLGDTIGVGTPAKARVLIEACAQVVPMAQLGVHFHDTYGQALANVYACLEAGVRIVDASVGGLGGCPYAKGASGNVATEDLVYMLHGLGLTTGIDLDALCETARWISAELGRKPASKLALIESRASC